ncbi:MAG: hypothetical protein OXC69_04195 [Candidatus Tectomicrobia bacterium]|nr:hypothetical protein [Candidatus Tectomicrobia bacterium]
MSYVTRTLVLLIVGLFVMTAAASADDRLTVSGNIDFRILFLENYSQNDRHYTDALIGSPGIPGQRGDEESLSWVHQRYRLIFNIEAFENTKVVAHTFFDKQWGVATYEIGVGAYGGKMTVEGYWLEGLIPGTAAKFEIGVPYMAAESGGWGAANKILNTAVPGVTLSTPLSDAINTYTWFAWIGQDVDGYASSLGGALGGEPHGDDFAFGSRATISVAEGLEVDLLYAYMLAECGAVQKANNPNTPCDTGALYGAGHNTAYDEDRHWIGSTLRYQYADFSFSPTFIAYVASDELAGDTESFLLDVRADYNIGPLSLSGRVVYTPASGINADGTQRTDQDYDVIGVWGIPLSVQWFSLYGNSSGTPTFNDLGPLLLGSTPQGNIRHEGFGLVHVAGKAAYTLTPQTTLSAAVGIFNTAEDTAGMSRESALAGTTYAGGSNLATEIDAWLDYQLYSNTTVSLFVAYAVMGDALDLVMDGVVYESQDAMGAGARIIYTF